MQPFQDELDDIVRSSGGTRLDNPHQLRAFKESFAVACKLLEVGPLLPSGRRGSLQLIKENKVQVWTAFAAKGEYRGTGSPCNTIPPMTLG